MLVTMSDKELSRINVIQSVIEMRMRRRDAVHQLALTERQTQRLMKTAFVSLALLIFIDE